MKHVFTLLVLGLCQNLPAQSVSDFELLLPAVDTFLDGSDGSGGFEDGNAFFPNFYSDEFGGFWAAGWAVSTMRDSTTAGFTNLFSARPAGGAEGSQAYAVGQQNAVVHLLGAAAGAPVEGLYVTNSTYAYLSMRDGDMFAKKFGGPTGDDPDFFKLTVRAYLDGSLQPDSVEFFLADFRFEDNAQDYIVEDWTWLDLQPLGPADSLLFTLSSSDVGPFGINTPLFFCIDRLKTRDASSTTASNRQPELRLHPNPTPRTLHLSWQNAQPSLLYLLDASGTVLRSEKVPAGVPSFDIDLEMLSPGIYWLVLQGASGKVVRSFVKL